MRAIATCLLLFSFSALSANAVPKECFQFLLKDMQSVREVNPDWLRIGAPLALTPVQVGEVNQLHDWLSGVFAVGNSAQVTSLKGFAGQLDTLKSFAEQLQNRMMEWQNLLQNEPFPTGQRQLRLESDIERMETLLAHKDEAKAGEDLQRTIDELARNLGRPSLMPLSSGLVHAWLAAQKGALLELKAQLDRKRRETIAFCKAARPVLDTVIAAIEKTKLADYTYVEATSYAYILAGIEEYFAKLIDPDLDNIHYRDGRVIGELQILNGTSPTLLLEEGRDLANAVLKGKPVEPDRVASLSRLMENSDLALQDNRLIAFVAGDLSAKAELAVGFLPIQFLRLPSSPAPSRVLDTMSSPGAVFIDDMIHVGGENSSYNRDGLKILSEGTLPTLGQSFELWETLLHEAGGSPKTLALLHLIRFHDGPFAMQFSPNWSDPTSVLHLLMQEVAVTGGNPYELNEAAAQATQRLLPFYQREFGFQDAWTLEDVLTSLDILVEALAKPEVIIKANLDTSASVALIKDPSHAVHAFLEALRREGRLN